MFQFSKGFQVFQFSKGFQVFQFSKGFQMFQFSKGFQVFQFSKDHLQLQLFQLCHPFHLNWSMFVNKLSLYLYLYVFKHCFLLYLAAKLIGTIAKKLLPQILSVLPRVVGSTSAPPQGDPENHIMLQRCFGGRNLILEFYLHHLFPFSFQQRAEQLFWGTWHLK